jgi:prophage regulatory protein
VTDRLLRRPEVERETGLSRPTIYRQMEAGNFPRPRRIGAQAVAWLQSDIDAWKATRPITTPAGRN